MPYVSRRRTYRRVYRRPRRYIKKRRTVRGVYKNKKQVARRTTGTKLPSLVRQNQVAPKITFPLLRHNEWKIKSPEDPIDSTIDARIVFEINANHPGLDDPAYITVVGVGDKLALKHIVGPTILDENGSSIQNGFMFSPSAAGANPSDPNTELYMAGYKQFLGFPGSTATPLYKTSVVTGSKLTLKIEVDEDQMGLKDFTKYSMGTPETIEKWKSGKFHVFTICCKRSSGALKGGNIFEFQSQNPDAKYITCFAYDSEKNRNGIITSTFSAKKAFGTDIYDDQDVHLSMTTTAGYKGGMNTGNAEVKMYENVPEKDYVHRIVIVPDDPGLSLPDFKVQIVTEMKMLAWDINKSGQSLETMRKAQTAAQAKYARGSWNARTYRRTGGSKWYQTLKRSTFF